MNIQSNTSQKQFQPRNLSNTNFQQHLNNIPSNGNPVNQANEIQLPYKTNTTIHKNSLNLSRSTPFPSEINHNIRCSLPGQFNYPGLGNDDIIKHGIQSIGDEKPIYTDD